MKKNILLLSLIITIVFNGLTQNYIYKGNNKYEATNTWDFRNGKFYIMGETVELTVAKHSNGGYLMISLDVPPGPSNYYYLCGTVTVFLSDGSIIKCTDKGMRDNVDSKIIALYNFTLEEIKELCINRITKIRFSVMDTYQGIKTFTADNNKGYSFSIFDKDNNKNYYETDIEIYKLFFN